MKSTRMWLVVLGAVVVACGVLAANVRYSARDRGQEAGEIVRKVKETYYRNVDAPDPKQVFEQNLPALREHVRSSRVLTSSSMMDRRDCAAYRRIVALGPRAVPHIVRQFLDEPESNTEVRYVLSMAWQEASGFGNIPDANPWYRTTIEEWWEGGQQLTDQRFAEAYADDDLEAIRWLGVAALPRVMQNIKQGDHRMLNVVQRVTVGKANLEGQSPAEKAKSCLAWWEANRKWWTIPFPDRREEDTARNQ